MEHEPVLNTACRERLRQKEEKRAKRGKRENEIIRSGKDIDSIIQDLRELGYDIPDDTYVSFVFRDGKLIGTDSKLKNIKDADIIRKANDFRTK